MSKKTKKQEKEETIKEQETEYLYTLVELALNSNVDEAWLMYNISRAGLMQQFEQELQDFGQKHIEPTLTIKQFNDIITGKQ